MNFESENILVETFLSHPVSFYSKVTGKRPKRYFVLREFDSGYGIADIVLGSFAPYYSIRSVRSSIDSNWASTLVNAQNNGAFSLSDFAKKNSVSEDTAREKINQFIAAGYLKKKGRYYVKSKEYKMVLGTTIAIEAKLRNWKHALSQARRYRRFAHYSYVLLDKKYSNPAENNIEIFKKFGIGLITMENKIIEIHFSPKKSDIPMNNYYYKLNESVHDYFKTTYVYS